MKAITKDLLIFTTFFSSLAGLAIFALVSVALILSNYL